MKRIRFKIIKDNKKDTLRKSKFCKGAKVTYPMFEAKLEFNGKKIEFSEHDFGTTYTSIEFPKKVKVQKNRREYGDDYCSLGGDLVLLKYRLKGKSKILTSIDIIGNTKRKTPKRGSVSK